MPRSYTRAEADEILRRALAEQPADGINHDDLVAAAREVGIPAEAVERAAGQVQEHGQLTARAELIRQRKRRAFAQHLLVYAIVNAGIFLVDWLDGGAYFFYFPLIVWGVIVALFGLRQLAPDREALLRKAEREVEKDRRRALRRARRASRGGRPHRSKSRVEAEFDAAVEAGVSALLSAVARGIRSATSPEHRYRVDDAERSEEPAGQPDEPARSRRRS